ncbi:PfkB family carbohydrate kinase [Sediminicoccus sp. KRV36]|uniref:PfkB family carbohydrate kinase n=1 Tax=Sediminicoccus sp. KRV36 TaxID=3133721 RepID=UPI00200D15A1|nr:PfkB family carbohydrate kinase [Sediminicoccus rosea]UPY38180.1 PfkB family carbohydrate kinase [Sediminicoccus rosea]
MTARHDIAAEIGRIREQVGSARIAFVSGNFNVLHAGHLRLFKFARDTADVLVVGVNPDSTAGVTVPADLRLEGLLNNTLIDHAVLLDGAPEELVTELRPDVVVKGKEYAQRHNAELAAVEAYGGKLVFSSGEVRFSTFSLLQREYSETNFSTIIKPRDYPRRHGFDIAELKSILTGFQGLRVLVVGDLIVDRYINCDPLGMSQEDPTIVVTPIESKTFLGGAGIVAAHARGMGASVHFITVTGRDEQATFAQQRLAEQGVVLEAFEDTTRPTTLKQRFRAQGKTLLRVNELRQHPVDPAIGRAMIAAAVARLDTTDLILFADFNYGCLPQYVVDGIVGPAAERGIAMAADSQASSQLSDISRFTGMRLVTPTEREARLALQDFESGLVIIAERLKAKGRTENMVVTLGSEGMLIRAAKGGMEVTDRLPAFNTTPKDVAGAGDSFFTCAAMALCRGVDIWRSAYLGSLAAACQVSRVGNTPLGLRDLFAEIDDPS